MAVDADGYEAVVEDVARRMERDADLNMVGGLFGGVGTRRCKELVVIDADRI